MSPGPIGRAFGDPADVPVPFRGLTGIHVNGSNYLCADGHVKWLLGYEVSGGNTNNKAVNPQGSKPGLAEGTTATSEKVGDYQLTFSTR
jgi:prepilin-type processing-associated H-X9-DG protein